MGEVLGPIMLFGMFIVAPVMAGLNAAKTQCSLLSQVKDVQNQTADFIKTEEKLLASLQNLDNSILTASKDAKSEMNAAINQLQLLRVAYAVSMKQMELTIACVLIVVFMLLLGKKLKIY